MDETILDRRNRVLKIARQSGFTIRGVTFPDGGATTWCEIRGQRTLFLDLGQTAAEQIVAVREILETTARIRPGVGVTASVSSAADPATVSRAA